MEKLLHIASVISKDRKELIQQAKSYAEENKSAVLQEMQSIAEKNSNISKFAKSLFPNGIPQDAKFFSRISNLQYCLGWNSASGNVIGLLWTYAHRRLGKTKGTALLKLFPDSSPDFFLILSALPAFLSNIDLKSEFAKDWFLILCRKASGDLAGGPFYYGMHQFGFNHPRSSLQIVEDYLKANLEGFRLDVSSVLLGGMRAWAKKAKVKNPSMRRIETKLKKHPLQRYRRCFNQSWVGMFREGTIGIDSLCRELNKFLEWTEEDKEDAFSVISRCLLQKIDETKTVKKGLLWIQNNVLHATSPLSRLAISNLIIPLYERSKKPESGIDPSGLDALFLGIQPIPKDENNTWSEVEHYLVSRLKANVEVFKHLLKEIARRNPKFLSALIKEHKLNYVITEFAQANPSEFVSCLLLADSSQERKLGRALLTQIDISTLDGEVVQQKANSRRLRILLLEISRKPFTSEIASRVFQIIYPLYENVEQSARSEFIEEMTLQAINYPGSCLEKWKEIPERSPLLNEVIEKTDEYFDQLRSAEKCGGKLITFPQLKPAFRDWERRFASEVDSGAKQASIFRSLVRNYQIIYGSQWSTYQGGVISPPRTPQSFAHGTEFPRVELLDPEGMSLRRLRANAKLREMLEESSNREHL